MTNDQKKTRQKPRGAHHASHLAWAVSKTAFVWVGKRPVKPNLVPFAKELTAWFRREGDGISIFSEKSKQFVCQPTNQYTYSLSAISLCLAAAFNEGMQFSESKDFCSELDAEVMRIRFETEVILAAARFCEAAIKQLLCCSNFPVDYYKRASLGQLLARDCEYCRSNGDEGHDISLIGSLAHRYFLCDEFERCAIEHLALVSRRRNLEAAHSNSQTLHTRSSAEAKAQLHQTLNDVGADLSHLAGHIGAIEEKLIAELNLIVDAYPSRPAYEDLLRVPVRWVGQYYPEVLAANRRADR